MSAVAAGLGGWERIHPIAAMLDKEANTLRRAGVGGTYEGLLLQRIALDRTDPGHVYFVLAHDLRRIKIGFTRDVERRFNSLNNSSPCELELLGSVRGGVPVEAALHCFLTQDRAKGEWFHATDRVCTAVELALRIAAAPRPGRLLHRQFHVEALHA